MVKQTLRSCILLLLSLAAGWACMVDTTIRAYLSENFWMPFAKLPGYFEKKNVKRIFEPFAGMAEADGDTPLAKLRAAYHPISQPQAIKFDAAALKQAVAAARADETLTPTQREEVGLIDAKIDLRAGQPGEPESLQTARKKLEAFLRTARTPEYVSEARGWLARVHYLLGNQTRAGKMYLDELNRNGSNLSRFTLLNSLQMTYGYDGGKELVDHIHEYFDTPEHAAFAIQMITNPHVNVDGSLKEGANHFTQPYKRIKALLEKHRNLFKSNAGATALALLTMRTALRMGDLPEARSIADAIPADATIRTEPDFNWMLASAHYLAREYAAAESPLLALFRSSRSSDKQKAAAAYALCGMYFKTGNAMERLRFALWLRSASGKYGSELSYPSVISDMSVYFAISGWDLNMLLEAETPTDVLEAFVNQHPNLPAIRVVKYSLAVRLTRENRYQEAAELYQSIHAIIRAPRTQRLAALYEETNRTTLSDTEKQAALYRFAHFLAENPNRIYFNDALWQGMQTYALSAANDTRLTEPERQSLTDAERNLKDDQEELWRAYLILRDIVRDSTGNPLARKSATLAINCLRRISDRFGRQDEIRKADIELSNWLRR